MSKLTLSEKMFDLLAKAELADKLLDVSKITSKGTGARIIEYPKSDRSSKLYVGDLAIASDNYDAYKFAIDSLNDFRNNGEFAIYAQTYYNNYVKNGLPSKPSTRSPIRSPARSPVRSPVRVRSGERYDFRYNV